MQKIAKIIGENGCYFLSLLYLAEKNGKQIDALRAYQFCLKKGWIDEDCFVNRPDLILSHYTGKNYSVSIQQLGYKLKQGELCITLYEWKKTLETLGHFVVQNPDGVLEYDPLGNSNTVKNGKPKSYRVFTKIKD